MTSDTAPLLLVVEDVEEIRDGIVLLLTADGYRVDPARDEEDAVVRATRTPPHLMLVSLGEPAMRSFPGNPKLIKGGLIVLDAASGAVTCTIALQYNPDQRIVTWAHVQNSDMKKWLDI